ncbi:hypothetical protein PENANT_c004G07154 [Penicillium antarcticum]|uniref:Uncharacterized protein n=1 Tax=Penicillium antarcticum TaxID=416450 RepID=A0A1V6QHU7_9EURO|nr:uncharacterized protein N7508_002406 [Penicillium antarcticum]KAJ5317898.1 hypothetical protein N7508_002406 [Penicillium antarcticum]OQD88436.1 hypothetical protein PENANT_c004G07154 [Penicillium antarcticum]
MDPSGFVLIGGFAVPKLNGPANYSTWIGKLEHAMRFAYPNHWSIVTGEMLRPSHCQETPGVNLHLIRGVLTQDQIFLNQFMTQLQINDLMAELNEFIGQGTNPSIDQEWLAKSTTVYNVLLATLDADLACPFRQGETGKAFELFTWLQDTYGKQSRRALIEMYQSWRSIHYNGGDRRSFVKQFQATSQKLAEIIGNPVDVALEFSRFMDAIAGHEGSLLIAAELGIDLKSPFALHKLYRCFEEGVEAGMV